MEPTTPLLGPAWFRSLAADWFRHLARKRRSAGTRETYTTPLRHLGRWLEDEGIDDPNLLDRQVLDRWQDTLIARGISEKTHSLYAGAIRGLLRWGGRESRVPRGLDYWIESPEVPDHEPLALERDQLEAVADRFREPRGDLTRLRDRALFWFLVTSAARISEVLRLDLVDVDRKRWVVRQKGGGEKTLVISTVARAWLAQYLSARGRDGEPALWIHIGPLVGRRRLSARDANRIWSRITRELGLPRFTSRWLRGTNATELNELGNTPIDTAHHLGHHGLASIMKYAKLRTDRRQAMVDGLDQLIPPAPVTPPKRRGRPRPKRGRQAPDVP